MFFVLDSVLFVVLAEDKKGETVQTVKANIFQVLVNWMLNYVICLEMWA